MVFIAQCLALPSLSDLLSCGCECGWARVGLSLDESSLLEPVDCCVEHLDLLEMQINGLEFIGLKVALISGVLLMKRGEA